MKFSIVTISFNQAQYLERAIRSVLDQAGVALEYIVVDPGSTDGSRDIIEHFRPRLAKIIYERDRGAADGLNKGFAAAGGEIFGFLNSDDVLLPNALSEAAKILRERPDVDVVSGACNIVDRHDRHLRRSFSDRFTLRRCAYGASILIQPSTFFRAAAYKATGGFNVDNRLTWDGELFLSMLRGGAKFARCNRIWSGYRLHDQSITGSARLHAAMLEYQRRIFSEIIGRDATRVDRIRNLCYRGLKYLETPQALTERLLRGPVYGRFKQL